MSLAYPDPTDPPDPLGPMLAAIGAGLQEYRDARGLGWSAALSLTGLNPGTLYRVEHGQANLRALATVATALGLTVEVRLIAPDGALVGYGFVDPQAAPQPDPA